MAMDANDWPTHRCTECGAHFTMMQDGSFQGRNPTRGSSLCSHPDKVPFLPFSGSYDVAAAKRVA